MLVALEQAMHRILIVMLLVLSSPVRADVRYRVLVPIYFDRAVPGAFGSMWLTQLAIHNAGAEEFVIDTCNPPAEDRGCLLYLDGDEVIEPGETQQRLPGFRYPVNASIPGRVLHMVSERAGADTVSYQLRVADTSRSALSAGTEVPVVRERDFRTHAAHLLNVPTDARFRLTFRLYEMNLRDAAFTVRIYDQGSGSLLSSREVRLQPLTPQTRIVVEPGFLQLDVATLISQAAAPATIRFEVEPRTPGSAFWTFVSITNNETQHFTLVTPQ
jgi:hypothetical protein